MGMERTIETEFSYEINKLNDNRVRIVIKEHQTLNEVGVLYFEKAKRIFFKKPVSLGGWACVDAKVGDLYDKVDYEITPKDVVNHCQELIMWAGL